jgi:hypothetical protein
VLFAGVKSPEGKLVQQCPYHPRLYHFSPLFPDGSGTKREKRGTGPEQSEGLRREAVRASIDALQRPTARDPVFRQVSMARDGVSGTLPEFFFDPARNRPGWSTPSRGTRCIRAGIYASGARCRYGARSHCFTFRFTAAIGNYSRVPDHWQIRGVQQHLPVTGSPPFIPRSVSRRPAPSLQETRRGGRRFRCC